MHALLQKLSGGDRRSIGRADAVAAEVEARPELVGVLIDGLLEDDPLVRMRAADALEKATMAHPEWLQPHACRLLREVGASEQQEVRWHLALMVPRLSLNAQQRRQATTLLLSYLDDRSSIVRTCSMQGLAELALAHPQLRPRIIPLLEGLTRDGTPAMRSRGRKLLARLKSSRPAPDDT